MDWEEDSVTDKATATTQSTKQGIHSALSMGS